MSEEKEIVEEVDNQVEPIVVESAPDVESTPVESDEDPLPSFGDTEEETDEILRIKKENLELREQIKKGSTPLSKPTLAKCDYNEPLYEEKLGEWLAANKKEVSQETDVFTNKLTEYNVQKKALKNHEFYELKVVNKLSNDQQAIIVAGVDDPAKFIYALGRDDSILEELSKIGNNAQFAKRVYKLEEKLTRPKKPEPEKAIKGGASTDSNSAKLDKLRAEALRTGDVSRVVQFKRANNMR